MTTGLARFVRPDRAAPAGAPVPGSAGPGSARSGSTAPIAEPCDICGTTLSDHHDHLVDLSTRSLTCACRACALLFTNPGAGGGRYRLVPDRVVAVPGFTLSALEWEDLQIPVGVAFFFMNSDLDRWVAFYPSPAGATESVLPLDGWAAVLALHPVLATAETDVEAVLLRRRNDDVDCFMVPISDCYELVGLMRLQWRGFDGGEEVRAGMDAFFHRLAERAAS